MPRHVTFEKVVLQGLRRYSSSNPSGYRFCKKMRKELKYSKNTWSNSKVFKEEMNLGKNKKKGKTELVCCGGQFRYNTGSTILIK